MFDLTPAELRKQLLSVVQPGWQVLSISDFSTLTSGTTPPRSRGDFYYAGGAVPWVKTGDLTNGDVTQVKENITLQALTDCSCQVNGPGTVLVAMYGGFKQVGRTGLLKIPAATNQAITAISVDPSTAVPAYVQEWLNAVVTVWQRVAASTRKDPNIRRSDIASLPILLPPLERQRKVAAVGAMLHAQLTLLSKLIVSKGAHEAALRELLTGGQRRLRGFTEEWTECHLGRLTAESRLRISDIAETPQVFGVTNDRGLVESAGIDSDCEKYKVVKQWSFAYNPMRLNVGSIACHTAPTSIAVSPDYVVFSCHQNQLRPRYLRHLIKTNRWRHFTNASGSGSVRVRVYYKDLARFACTLPPLSEQDRIVDLLDKVERELGLLKQLRVLASRRRRWTMDRLLTGRSIGAPNQ